MPGRGDRGGRGGGRGGRGGRGDGGRGGRGGGRGGGDRGGSDRGSRGINKGGRGGRGGKGMKGGQKVVVVQHRHPGIYIAQGDNASSLLTKSFVPGESVYGEKRISVEGAEGKVEYRVWNPFRSKIAAAIVGGIENIYIEPGSKVLYLGAASGTTVSHVSDIVGPVHYRFFFIKSKSLFIFFLKT